MALFQMEARESQRGFGQGEMTVWVRSKLLVEKVVKNEGFNPREAS